MHAEGEDPAGTGKKSLAIIGRYAGPWFRTPLFFAGFVMFYGRVARVFRFRGKVDIIL